MMKVILLIILLKKIFVNLLIAIIVKKEKAKFVRCIPWVVKVLGKNSTKKANIVL